MSYCGEMCGVATMLTFDQVLPAMPPRGFGGSVDPLRIATGPTLEALRDPSNYVLPVSDWPSGPRRASVMAHQDDWDMICQYCVDDNVFEVTTEDQIPRDADGELLLVGAFGVSKPTRLLDGRDVLRMVINAIPSNLIQLMIMGDLGMLPVDPPWSTLILGLGEGLLWDSEDVKSCFTIFMMIAEWRRYFTLSKQAMVNGAWCWLRVAVLPMGWLSAVGVAQHLLRRVLTVRSQALRFCRISANYGVTGRSPSVRARWARAGGGRSTSTTLTAGRSGLLS